MRRLSDNIKVFARTPHELLANFATAEEISYKRHKSCLERRRAKPPPKVTIPAQGNFASQNTSEHGHISKALQHGRTAMQAADHVQACLSQQQQRVKPRQTAQAPSEQPHTPRHCREPYELVASSRPQHSRALHDTTNLQHQAMRRSDTTDFHDSHSMMMMLLQQLQEQQNL
jgi:hypothetical protein